MRNNKLFTTLFVILLSCFAANAQYTDIPDVNFEQALISQGYDSGSIDHKVLTSMISGITSLDVSSRNISDLKGIWDFSALKTLNCSYNQLTSLNVATNALTELDCSSNRLVYLNVKNGNNSNITTFKATSNPNLHCILADNATAPNASWYKDATASYSTTACYTAIPDVNFEQALISKGYDSGSIDHQVLTYKIAGITSLDVSSRNISDLTGIQDFAALQTLSCYSNSLTALDVSKNTALTELECKLNSLTALDVSKNTTLETLVCHANQLKTFDVSQNISLISLECSYNQLAVLDVSKNTYLKWLYCENNSLTSLDVTQNTSLTGLWCSSNALVNLNIKNGNNKNMENFYAYNNPNLTCIQADSATALYLGWQKDATASYSTTPCALSTSTFTFNKNESSVLVYPNPTHEMLNIEMHQEITAIIVMNLLGQQVMSQSVHATQATLDISSLSEGAYLLKVISGDISKVIKVVKD